MQIKGIMMHILGDEKKMSDQKLSEFFLQSRNIQDLADIMNQELEKINVWVKVNKLAVNVSKTKYIIFRPSKKRIHESVTIRLNNETINEVNETKFLGVIMDRKMSWQPHIMYIKNKIAKGLGIILKTRKQLKIETLRTLYYSFIYPYLIYGIEVWGNSTNTNLNQLFKIQKKAIRIITLKFSKFREHTGPKFKITYNFKNLYAPDQFVHV